MALYSDCNNKSKSSLQIIFLLLIQTFKYFEVNQINIYIKVRTNSLRSGKEKKKKKKKESEEDNGENNKNGDMRKISMQEITVTLAYISVTIFGEQVVLPPAWGHQLTSCAFTEALIVILAA